MGKSGKDKPKAVGVKYGLKKDSQIGGNVR